MGKAPVQRVDRRKSPQPIVTSRELVNNTIKRRFVLRMHRRRSDRDAYRDKGAFRIRKDNLTNSPAQTNSERSVLQNPLDCVAGGVIQIVGDAEAQTAFVEQDVVA
jgi:hypothetical protein